MEKEVPQQELSMIHISEGIWLVGIDLLDKNIVTKNPLGLFCVTGDENLYRISREAQTKNSD